jgi:glucosamine--fructose-6-phosphate aminotransferase (isomerizing)
MTKPGVAMEREVGEGPAAIASAVAAASEIRPQRPRGIVVFARGTSDHAAIYGRYVIEAIAGVPVVLGAPSLATVYDAPTDLRDWLAIGVSQSGATREIVACLSWAKARGAGTIGITNDPDSELAISADMAIDLGCGEERAVAATKTFVAECAALAALGYFWADVEPDWDAVADAGEAVMAAPLDESVVEVLAGADVLAVLGRGYRYPIALEIALKLMEACRLWAVGMSWADLLHGPITAVPSGASCLLLEDRDLLAESSRAFAERLEEAGARVVVPARLKGLRRVAEPLVPLIEAMSLQRAILVAARDRGLDPDRPDGLTKVTQT